MSPADMHDALVQALEDLADDCLCLRTWAPLASDPCTRHDMVARAERLEAKCDRLREQLGMTNTEER